MCLPGAETFPSGPLISSSAAFAEGASRTHRLRRDVRLSSRCAVSSRVRMCRLQRGFLGVGIHGLSCERRPPAFLPMRFVWPFRDVPPRKGKPCVLDEGCGWAGPALPRALSPGPLRPRPAGGGRTAITAPTSCRVPPPVVDRRGLWGTRGGMVLSRLRALTSQLAPSFRACPLGRSTAPFPSSSSS